MQVVIYYFDLFIALFHYIYSIPDNFNWQHSNESHKMDQPGPDMMVTINFILGHTSVISTNCFEMYLVS